MNLVLLFCESCNVYYDTKDFVAHAGLGHDELARSARRCSATKCLINELYTIPSGTFLGPLKDHLENINCTGLFYSIEISYLFIQLRTISIQNNLNSSDRHWLL
jgi:hypothetical protein